MWDSNAPLQLLKSMPEKLSKENLEKLQLVLEADKYKNSLVSCFDLCGMYAPFCKGCKKTSIYPCAISYVNMMRSNGMNVEIDARPVSGESNNFSSKPQITEKPVNSVVEEVAVADARQEEVIEIKEAEQKEADAKRTKEEEAIKKIVDKSNMEIPDAMLATQIETMIEEFAQRISGQGLSFEQYLQFSGMTMEKLKEQVKPDALSRIQNGLVLEQIAKEENIEVTEEELDAEIEKMAASYQVTPDQIKTFMNDSERDSMKKDVAVQKAVELVMANIKERAKPKSKKEEAE